MSELKRHGKRVLPLLVVRYAIFRKETLSFEGCRLLKGNAHVFALEADMQFTVREESLKEPASSLSSSSTTIFLLSAIFTAVFTAISLAQGKENSYPFMRLRRDRISGLKVERAKRRSDTDLGRLSS